MDYKERLKEILKEMHEAQLDGAIPTMIAEAVIEFDRENKTPWEHSVSKYVKWNIDYHTSK